MCENLIVLTNHKVKKHNLDKYFNLITHYLESQRSCETSKGEAMLAKTVFPTGLLVLRSFSSVASKTLLKMGDVLRETRVFSSEDVKAYAEVSHDWNSLHFDPESAREAGFEDRLVHGMLVSSMFPRIISAHFPGAVYVSQSLHFRSPVYVGDEILGLVQAIALRETKNKYIVKFSTKCFKNHNELVVIDGEATAILPNLEMLHNLKSF